MNAAPTVLLLALSAAAAQTTAPTTSTPVQSGPAQASPTQAMTGRTGQLSTRLGQLVGDVFVKVRAAAQSGDVSALRVNCARWQSNLQPLSALDAPEFTDFLTPANWAENPKLFDWIVNLRHLYADAGIAVGAACAPTPPEQAGLLTVYAIISNAYGVNRQMALQLQGR